MSSNGSSAPPARDEEASATQRLAQLLGRGLTRGEKGAVLGASLSSQLGFDAGCVASRPAMKSGQGFPDTFFGAGQQAIEAEGGESRDGRLRDDESPSDLWINGLAWVGETNEGDCTVDGDGEQAWLQLGAEGSRERSAKSKAAALMNGGGLVATQPPVGVALGALLHSELTSRQPQVEPAARLTQVAAGALLTGKSPALGALLARRLFG